MKESQKFLAKTSQNRETKTQMNKGEQAQRQDRLCGNWLLFSLKHKNPMFMGVFVLFAIGFLTVFGLQTQDALAATESKWASSHLTGSAGTPGNAIGSTNSTWTSNSGGSAWTSRWAMEDPSGSITGTQTINVRVRKNSSGGSTPTVTATLYENGSSIQTVIGSTSVTSDTGTTISGTFDASAITNPNNVEIEINDPGTGGSPSNRRSVQVDSIEWVVNTADPFTVSGNVYDDSSDSSTTKLANCDGSTTTMVALKAGSATVATTSCNATTGAFSFSGVPAQPAGAALTIWINNVSGVVGNHVIRYDGSGDVTGVALRKDRLIVSSEDANPITNAILDNYDNIFDPNDIVFSVDSGALTVEDGVSLIINSGDTFAPGGNVTTSPSNDGTDSVEDGDIVNQGTLNMSVGGLSLSVGGDYSGTNPSLSVSGLLTFTATATGHTLTVSSTPNLTFDGVGGGWTLVNNISVSGWLRITNGNLNASNRSISLTLSYTICDMRPFEVTGGTFTASTSIVAYYSTCSTGDTLIEDVSYYGLNISGTDTYKLRGNTTVAGTFNINGSGAVALQSYTLTVGDDFLNSGTANFNAGTGTVVFNDASKPTTVTGNNTFYNLTVNTPGETVNFTAGTITTIASGGTLTVAGSSVSPVVFNSTAASVWTINHQGSENIGYLNVFYGGCDALSANITLGGGSSKDANTGGCWVIPTFINISGTSNTTGTVALAVNNLLQAQTTTITGGSWTISSVTQPNTGDVITVWIDGAAESNESTGLTKYSGSGNISGMILNANQLSFASTNNADFSAAQIKNYTCVDDEDVMHGYSAGPNLISSHGCINSYVGETVYIGTDDSVAIDDSSIFDVHNLVIDGTLYMGQSETQELLVSGSLTVNYSFSTNDNVYLTLDGSSGSHTVKSSSTNFYGTLVNGSGAAWTLQDGLSTGVLNIQAGTLNAGTNYISLNGDSGQPLDISAGTFNPGTGTVSYGSASLSSVNIENTTYYNLEIGNLSGSSALIGNTVVTNNFVNGDTLAAGSHTLTVGGNFTNIGSFNAGTGTVIFNDSSKTSTVTSSTTPTGTADSNTDLGSFPLRLPADGSLLGQSFTGNGATLDKVSLRISRTGSPSGSITAYIYAHTGTYGNGVPGILLATSSTTITASTLSTSFGFVDFIFSGAERITLGSGTRYFIVLGYSGSGDTSNFVGWSVDGISPTHAGNAAYFLASWTVYTGDANFYVYTTGGNNLAFNNLTVNAGGKTVKFEAGKTFGVNGVLTVTGTSGNNVTFTTDDTTVPIAPWIINHQGTESITNLTVSYSSCDDSSTPIDATGAGNQNGGNNGACWSFPFGGITVGGTVYSGQGTGALASKTVVIRVNNTDSFTGETDVSGVYSISSVTADSGDVLTVFLDDETENATTVNVSAGVDVSDVDLYQNTLIVRHGTAGPITNTHLDNYDHANAGSDGDVLHTVTTGSMSLQSGAKLLVWTGKNYTPGGTVTTAASSSAASVAGDVEIQTSATLNMGSNTLTVGGDFLKNNSSTLTLSAGQDTVFTATAVSHTISLASVNPGVLEDVIFNGAGGVWGFSQISNTINGDITVTAGTLETANSITVNGGDVIGAGTINMTGSSTLTVSGAGAFGGSSNWTVNNLTLSGASSTTTGAGGSGGAVTVTGTLTVGSSHTFDAENKTWILSAASTPFSISGTFTPDTSTIRYTGNGATGVVATTYNVLELKPSSSSAQVLPAGTITAASLVIGDGTNAGATGATNNPVVTATGTMTIAAGATYTTGTGALTATGDFTNNGTFAATASGNASFGANWANNGTITTGTGHTTTFTATDSGNTLTGSASCGSFKNIVFNGSGGSWSIPQTCVQGNFTVTAGTVTSSNGVYFGGTSASGAGTVTLNGTLTLQTGSLANAGNWQVGNVVFGDDSSGTHNLSEAGTLTVTGIMTIDANHTVNAGSKTIILTGSGTPLVNNGTFNGQTSTVSYRGTSATNVTAASYGTLDFAPASGTPAYTAAAGTLSATTLALGGAGSATVNLDTNDPTVDINGAVTIGSGDALVASATGSFNAGGAWANSGTFTHSSGTVTFDAGSSVNVTSGASNGAFYNATFNNASGTWTLQDNLTIANVLTITDGNLSAGANTITFSGTGTPFVKSGGTFTHGTSTVLYDGSGNTTILALNGTSTTDAYYNLSIKTSNVLFPYNYTLAGSTTVNNNVTVGGNFCDGSATLATSSNTLTLKGSGTPLNFTNCGFLDSGSGTIIFASASGTTALANRDLTSTHDLNHVQINGTGTFNIGSNIDLGMQGNLTVTSGTLTGNSNNITINQNLSGNGDINLTTAGTVTLTGNSNIGSSTNWDFYNLTFGTGTTVTPFATGGGGFNIAGVMTIAANATLSAGPQTYNLTGTGTPLVVAGGITFGTSTFNYTGAGATNIAATTYYNLGIKPGANSAVHTLASGTLTVDNILTVGNGTNTGVTVTAATNNNIIDVNGTGTAVDIKAGTTFVAPGTASFTVAGSWANAGTFTHSSGTVTFDATSTGKTIASNGSSFNNITFNGTGGGWSPSGALALAGDMTLTAGTLSGTQNVTVNGGDVTGNGDIDMAGGTFTVSGTGSFGGSTAWDFTNLTVNGTTTSAGTGVITVDGVLALGASSTLNAGSRTWTLAGSGTPLTLGAGASFSSGTSQFTYASNTGVTAMSNTAMTGNNAFYALRFAPVTGGQTFTAGVSIEAKHRLYLTNTSTLAMGDNNLTVGNPSVSASGKLHYASTGGYLTQSSAGTTTILSSNSSDHCIIGTSSSGTNTNCQAPDGSSASFTFGNLVIGNGTNTFTGHIVGGGTTSIPIIVSGTLTITANATLGMEPFTNVTDITLTGNGTPFVNNGTFVAGRSTINFNSAGTSGTTIPALTYYNLAMNKAGNTFTAAGAMTVGNNLTITAGTFVAPAATLTVNNDFTNNGTFTHNSGTVVITPTTGDAVTIGGTSNTTFNNLTNTTPQTQIQFANGRTYTIDGTLTMTGSSGRPIRLQSDTPGTQWFVSFGGNGELYYVYVRDGGCSGGNTLTGQTRLYDQGNNGSCWGFIRRGGGGANNAPVDNGGPGGTGGTSGGGAGTGGGATGGSGSGGTGGTTGGGAGGGGGSSSP